MIERIVNLTLHPVEASGVPDRWVLPSAGHARARSSLAPAWSVDVTGTRRAVTSVTIYREEFVAIDGLPDPADGVALVVSEAVVRAARQLGRATSDLLIVGSRGELQVVGE